VIIRRIFLHEIETVLQLWRLSGVTPSRTDTVEDVGRLLKNDSAAFFVAETDGRIVGSLIATFDGWRGHIYRLAVLPEYRRKRIARQLVARSEETFWSWDVRLVVALVENDHPWAMAFWTAAGYLQDDRHVRFYKNL
jgi:ribosomal protein S18 acetylase RimI-like enzyme